MIVASNFKTNHTRKSTEVFLNSVEKFIKDNNIKAHSIVFPPATALKESSKNCTIGAQNCYIAKSGSFTGEIGLEQLEEFNIKTVLVGHSERRHIFNENNQEVVKKFNFFKENGFEIVYCIGEPLEVREDGIDSVIKYLKKQLDGVDILYNKLIVAYEPVWAIGTGKTATIDDIQITHSRLKEIVGKSVPILYGGSVKVENCKEILSTPEVDGILVGTASWRVENYIEMLKISNQIMEN